MGEEEVLQGRQEEVSGEGGTRCEGHTGRGKQRARDWRIRGLVA